MKQKSFFDQMLDQVASMVDTIEEKGMKFGEGELPKGIDDQIEQLAKYVELFKTINDEIFQKMGITEDEVQKLLNQDSSNFPKGGKRLFTKASKLKKEVETKHRAIKRSIDMAKLQKEKVGGDKKKRSIKRKKKFRGVGGKKGWKPL